MTFGKGQTQPNRKRAAAKAPFKNKIARKQAHDQGQQELEAGVDAMIEKVNYVGDALLERADLRDNASKESDEDDDYDKAFIMGGDRRLTMEERESFGLNNISHEELWVAIKVTYVREFDSPPVDDWGPLVTILRTRLGVSRRVIEWVFQGCHDGVANPEKMQKGGGHKHKLAEDNEGLIAGAAALNESISPTMATEICNAVNETTYPNKDLKICRNTFMATLKAYTDFESVAILRWKTGSKDPESDWAKAWVTIATQMDAQIKLGKQIDDSETTLQQAFKDVKKNHVPPPMFSDAIVYCDENHCIASIGGAGHEGSFSRRQYHIAVDPKTGKLLRLANGGVVPKWRFRVMAKYTKEARGCYGMCCPVVDGKEWGQFIETFDYTETKLVLMKVYKMLMQQEMTYHRKMMSQGWKNFNGDNPYEECYGEANWEAHLKNSPAMRKYK